MKKAILLIFAFCAFGASAITPFSYQFNFGDGSANTNVALMSAWPPQDNTITVVGTNIIYGGSNIVLTPSATGFGTNQAFAGSYRIFFTNLNFGFFSTIADTTTQLPLSTYVTGAPVFYEPINYYTLVTNWLSFPPATNTFGGIAAALGYTPATNTYPGITFALGMNPATNNSGGIVFALGYTPPTNTYAGISNVLHFVIATNGGPVVYSQLPYTPPTNTYAGISNVVRFVIATNGGPVSVAQLEYVPHTNDGYFGIPAAQYSIGTNGFVAWVAYKTNNLPGAAFTNLPTGSLLSDTNGGLYRLSNIVWRPLAL